MTGLETAMLAARLFLVSVAVLAVPGLAILAVLRARFEWHDRVVFAFALSYSWIFIVSVIVPLCGWTIDHAALLVALPAVASGVAAIRQGQNLRAVSTRAYDGVRVGYIGLLLLACAITGWIVEPPFTGEEGFDLVSISRFSDGGPITLENTSLFPDTRPVYLFQPYQMALGMIARWSGTDPLVAFVKFRAFLIPLMLVLLYSLLRRLAPTRTEAVAAFVVVLAFIALDVDTWEWNSLFPFVRRGGFSAGVLFPSLLILSLAATRRAEVAGQVAGRVALVAAPVMLAASMSTHPLEMFPLLCFVGGMAAAAVTGVDRGADPKRALALALLLLVTSGAYLAVHARAVSYVVEYERTEKLDKRQRLAELVADPVNAIAGGPTDANDLFIRTIPATTATVFGMPALAVAAARAPASAALLALGIVPLALVYATPAGFIVLQLLTSTDTVKNVNAYFGLLGLIAVALAMVTLAHLVLHAAAWRRRGWARVVGTSAIGSLVLWIAWIGGRPVVSWFVDRVLVQPELLLLVAVIAAATAVTLARARNTPIVPPAPFPRGVLIAAMCLAGPMIAPEWLLGGIFTKRDPITLFERVARADVHPSVLDWRSYYPDLKRTFHAALQPPRTVVDELRRQVPPRQVVLAHPRYSCELVVLIDAYCINPDVIQSHYFQPAVRYKANYVRAGDGPAPEHPFFNATSMLSEAERRLLADYGISYILADPEHAARIDGKLKAARVAATLEFERDGYRLYRITRP